MLLHTRIDHFALWDEEEYFRLHTDAATEVLREIRKPFIINRTNKNQAFSIGYYQVVQMNFGLN